ncbi:hypothetical protein PC129_g13229 [Phytophthora cactorum]|uniref:MULE transposase domain-containing protein n=1 Tax=Phytophthora cactorum TaxID=29920 RepID=A0A8T1BSF8_9STRA|nr:hypothetical protein Pcac1_g4408 [Phytophthora cactorum]KAG2894234.1 hypothetical protein PC114_g15985 [Phytophthora cactorum]KAG2905681.1 hypothetical protein PC115_g14538 [Phytophthora cactorum]KAG2921903.1 hypothetical protein PC117_g16120 [Phytophthora cactorum]KAG3003062.1 hypothetical protein PC119_g16140 [Phytophthora cactorum]
MQFHYVYAHAGVIKRMIGFAHPDLLRLLKYTKNPLFIDCTFKVFPQPFSQLAIVMGYDPAYDFYLPIFYVLLPDKLQDAYWHLLDNVIMQCDLQVNPRYVTFDFEMGLLNAVRQLFIGVSVVGCLFHWKQALRRKMIDLRIPQETVSHVMTAGVIDVLTVIPIGEITEKCIPFVRSRVDESGHRGKCYTF